MSIAPAAWSRWLSHCLNHPARLQLRLLQAVQTGSGNTIVLKMPGENELDNVTADAKETGKPVDQ